MYEWHRPECFKVRTSLVITRTAAGTYVCIYASKLNCAMLFVSMVPGTDFCLCQLHILLNTYASFTLSKHVQKPVAVVMSLQPD